MKHDPKIAIVVDWLTEGFGGGERVIKTVHEMYPNAPIYTSQYRSVATAWLGKADVRTGWLNHLPAGLRRFVPFLRQWYFARLNLSEYDVVISITGAEAKAVKTRPDAVHISYMHAPTQYYWTLYEQYIKSPGFGVLNPLVRFGLKLLVAPLRRADYKAAQQPDVVVTISSYMQREIQKHYGRDSLIIAPNVDVATVQRALSGAEPPQRSGFVVSGRQVSWKRMDVAIAAARLTGDELLVIGDGPEHERLVRLARGVGNITFLPSYQGVQEVAGHLAASKAFLFPSLEPFGIVAVEALAAGTPVVALRAGGALDFVQDGTNGVFFDEQTPESLAAAMKKCSELTFDAAKVAQSAERFSDERFRVQLGKVVTESVVQ